MNDQFHVNKMQYKISYLILTFCITFFIIGNTLFSYLKVGPLTLASYSVVILILYFVFTGQISRIQISNNIFQIYLLAILITAFALLVNGDFLDFKYFNFVFKTYLSSIIIFSAVILYIKSEKNIKYIFMLLFGLMVINSIFCVYQNAGNPYFDITRMLLIGNPEEGGFVESAGIGSYRDSAIGYGVPGIFDSRVNNAAFSSFLVFVPLYFLFKSKKFYMSIVWGTSYCFFMYVLFLTQQRSSFLLCVIASIFLVYKFYFSRYKLITIMFVLLFVFYFTITSGNVNLNELPGRFSDSSSNGRAQIYSYILNWISDNFIFGGPAKLNKLLYLKYGITGAHNYFLNAFVVGGIFGATFYILLYFKILIIAIKCFFYNNFKKNIVVLFSSTMILVDLVNSLVHNNGIIYGNFLLWIILGILYKLRYPSLYKLRHPSLYIKNLQR